MSHSTTVTIRTFLDEQVLVMELLSRTVSSMFGVEVNKGKELYDEDAAEALRLMAHTGQMGYHNNLLISVFSTIVYEDIELRRSEIENNVPQHERKFEYPERHHALVVVIEHFD